MATLHKESSHFVDTTNFAIALYDKTKDILNFALVYDNDQEITPFLVECAHHRGLAHYVLITQNPLLFEDLAELDKVDVETSHICPDKPILTWLGAPIPNPFKLGRNAQGVISMWSYQANAFNDADLQILSTIADQAAISLRYVQLAELLQQRAIEMAVINDVAQLLVSTLDWQELMARLTEQIEGMFNAEMGILFLRDDSTNELVFEAVLGSNPIQVEPFRLPAGNGLVGKVAQTSQAAMMADVKATQPLEAEFQKLPVSVKNALAVPLIVREQVIGVLEILNNKKSGFSENDLDLLSAVAFYIAIAMENIHQHEREKGSLPQTAPIIQEKIPSNPMQLVNDIVSRFHALQNEPSLSPHAIIKVQQIADYTMQQMRGVLFELHPPILESEGLVPALQLFLDQQQKESPKIKLSLKLKPLEPDTPIAFEDSKIEIAIFAIIQESVKNAISHAKAKNIILQITEHPEAFYILVADDGIGFDVSQVDETANSGIANMQKQADIINSELRIKAAPGMGTHIFIYLPKEDADDL